MSKFKVGDRVRVIKGFFDDLPVGTVGRVTGIDEVYI